MGEDYTVVNVEPRDGVAKCDCEHPSTLGPFDRMGTLTGGGVITESFCFGCHVWLHLVEGKPVATKLVPIAALRHLASEVALQARPDVSPEQVERIVDASLEATEKGEA